LQCCCFALKKTHPQPSRRRFRLRAADRVEKWSPVGGSDSGKSSPVVVPE